MQHATPLTTSLNLSRCASEVEDREVEIREVEVRCARAISDAMEVEVRSRRGTSARKQPQRLLSPSTLTPGCLCYPESRWAGEEYGEPAHIERRRMARRR
jgi:hypothetical protein